MDYTKKLYQLVEDNYANNQHIRHRSSAFYLQALKDEIDEVIEAVQQGTSAHIEFEIVDIFWTTLNLIEQLHHQHHIDKTTLAQKGYTKYAERLPNIVAGNYSIPKAEQDKLRNTAKKKQKVAIGLT